MTFLTRIINFKKPIIDNFFIQTNYNVTGGITNISWKSRNNFLSIIQIGFKFKLFFNSTKCSLFIYKKEKINLIVIGFFGINTSSLLINPTYIEKSINKKRYLNNDHIFKIKSKLSKPILECFNLNKELNNTVIKNISFSVKKINFKINNK